jgi:hypothetical protein
VRLQLGYAPAASVAERKVQRSLMWEAPMLSRPLRTSVPRWSAGPTWTPPGTILLVRHRSSDGARRIVSNDRIPPAGYEIEYDLGLVHCFAQPGTQRLVAGEDGFFCTPFEGQLVEGLRSLGYVETAPLPLLDALELRRDPWSGEPTLVAGVADPLYAISEPLGHVGFIESYPLNPREAPDVRVDRLLTPLFRWTDGRAWRHRYGVGDSQPEGAVVLGSVAPRSVGGEDLIDLQLLPDGRLATELLPASSRSRPSPPTAIRWSAAPVVWGRGLRPWGLRASANRLRHLPRDVAPRSRAGESQAIGLLRRAPVPGWSPLFAAMHPVLGDQFLTRSALEAQDMGYVVDGVLGWIADHSADRSPDSQPAEIKWASRFGKRRRYVEGPLPGMPMPLTPTR